MSRSVGRLLATAIRPRPRLVGLILAIAALAMVPVLLIEPMRVGADSMSPTLRPGDHVLLDKVTDRARHPHRRDIVAFTEAGSGAVLIKRVVAIAGDTVGIEDGTLVVNGRPQREQFVDQALSDGTYFGPVSVPHGTVFVLGDNRPNSLDSRRYGPIPLGDVIGRVLVRIWPP